MYARIMSAYMMINILLPPDLLTSLVSAPPPFPFPPSLPRPPRSQYPHAGRIDHSWVAFEWAHDCGLAQLTEILTSNLVDGRVLNSLSKEDLKKYLKITKKADQLSFLSGVELLRMHDFNREVRKSVSKRGVWLCRKGVWLCRKRVWLC